jgi:hypothetical protein
MPAGCPRGGLRHGLMRRRAACRRSPMPGMVYARSMEDLPAGTAAGRDRGCGHGPWTGSGDRITLAPGPPAAAGSPVVPGSRLNPASWEQGSARPAGPAEEEWAHADSAPQHPPPPPHRGASSGRRDNTGREDQDKLRRPTLRGLGSAAMPIAARSGILVRPAYLPAVDPPPMTGSQPRAVCSGLSEARRRRAGSSAPNDPSCQLIAPAGSSA